MRTMRSLLWLAFSWHVEANPMLRPQGEGLIEPNGIVHASHIFNALHNSMKEFGSVLQHNGLSFFIATISSGVEFYHGSASPYRVNGTEWLAFEPEHALAFAHPQRVHHSEAGRVRDKQHQHPKDESSWETPKSYNLAHTGMHIETTKRYADARGGSSREHHLYQ